MYEAFRMSAAYLRGVHVLATNGQQNLANGYTRTGTLGLSKGPTHSSLHNTSALRSDSL